MSLEPSFSPLEQWHAYDHVIRLRAYELGLTDTLGEDYAEKQEKMILAHEYRAFFDAADFLSVAVRKRIAGFLAPFSSTAISSVFPEYYSSIRDKIDRVSQEIAMLRTEKDMTTQDQVLNSVEHYRQAISELLGLCRTIETQLPELDKEDRERENDS